MTVLLSENGAGKTTALRILLGLMDADSGSSEVYGLDSWQHGDDIRHRVGYVPDQPALYEWMTVDEIGWYCGGFYQQDFVTKYRETGRRIRTATQETHQHNVERHESQSGVGDGSRARPVGA